MDQISFIPEETWHPLATFGLEHPFFGINATTMLYTWAAMAMIIAAAIVGRVMLAYPNTAGGYVTKSIVRSFMDLTQESFGEVIFPYYGFITTLFIFIFIANTLLIFPGLEEPTGDINTTIAMGLISFVYTQVETFRAHGWFGYIQEFIIWPMRVRPKGAWSLQEVLLAPARLIVNVLVGCIALPFEMLGQCSKVVSLSLRLFGNIFGGSVIAKVIQVGVSGSALYHTLAIVTGLNIIVALFFGIFEAFIQAFVFTVLSMTYLSIGTKS